MAKRNIFISLAVGLSVMFGMTMSTQPVQAAECGGAKTSIIDCGGKKSDKAIIDLVKQVINIMTVGIGILAVGAVIVGGILYSSAGGNPDNIKKAKTIWTNTVIGLILFAFLVAITNFIIPGGVFG